MTSIETNGRSYWATGTRKYDRPTNQEIEIMKTVFETIVDCRGKSDRFFWGMKLGRGDDRTYGKKMR